MNMQYHPNVELLESRDTPATFSTSALTIPMTAPPPAGPDAVDARQAPSNQDAQIIDDNSTAPGASNGTVGLPGSSTDNGNITGPAANNGGVFGGTNGNISNPAFFTFTPDLLRSQAAALNTTLPGFQPPTTPLLNTAGIAALELPNGTDDPDVPIFFSLFAQGGFGGRLEDEKRSVFDGIEESERKSASDLEVSDATAIEKMIVEVAKEPEHDWRAEQPVNAEQDVSDKHDPRAEQDWRA